MQYSNCDFLGSQVACIDDSGNSSLFALDYPESHSDIQIEMLYRSPFCHPAVIFHRSCFEFLQYDQAYDGIEDYVLFSILIANGFIASNYNDCLLRYRVHSDQSTTQYKTSLHPKHDLAFSKYWKSLGLVHPLYYSNLSFFESLKAVFSFTRFLRRLSFAHAFPLFRYFVSRLKSSLGFLPFSLLFVILSLIQPFLVLHLIRIRFISFAIILCP